MYPFITINAVAPYFTNSATGRNVVSSLVSGYLMLFIANPGFHSVLIGFNFKSRLVNFCINSLWFHNTWTTSRTFLSEYLERTWTPELAPFCGYLPYKITLNHLKIYCKELDSISWCVFSHLAVGLFWYFCYKKFQTR